MYTVSTCFTLSTCFSLDRLLLLLLLLLVVGVSVFLSVKMYLLPSVHVFACLGQCHRLILSCTFLGEFMKNTLQHPFRLLLQLVCSDLCQHLFSLLLVGKDHIVRSHCRSESNLKKVQKQMKAEASPTRKRKRSSESEAETEVRIH